MYTIFPLLSTEKNTYKNYFFLTSTNITFQLFVIHTVYSDNIISQPYIMPIVSQLILLGWDAIKTIKGNEKSYAELTYPM